MIIGDLALYAGIVGIILYVCILTIRHTTRIGKLTDNLRKHDDHITALKARKEDLVAQHRLKHPEVDALVKRVLELRESRDRLQVQYNDLLASAEERTIEIKTARS